MKSPNAYHSGRGIGPGRHSNGGFTLIEVAAVVAILAIMMSIFIVKMDTMTPGARLRAGARTVGSTVELAISDAVMKGKRRSVIYDMRKATLTIEADRADEETRSAVIFTKVLPIDVEMSGIEGLEVDHDMAILTVYPSGRTTPHLVRLTNKAGEMTVEIYGITGRIAYHDGYTEMKEFTRETADEER